MYTRIICDSGWTVDFSRQKQNLKGKFPPGMNKDDWFNFKDKIRKDVSADDFYPIKRAGMHHWMQAESKSGGKKHAKYRGWIRFTDGDYRAIGPVDAKNKVVYIEEASYKEYVVNQLIMQRAGYIKDMLNMNIGVNCTVKDYFTANILFNKNMEVNERRLDAFVEGGFDVESIDYSEYGIGDLYGEG